MSSAPQSSWWSAVLTDGDVLMLGAAILIGAAVLVLAGRAWWRLHRHRALRGLWRAQRGTATMEFVLVFPIMLTLVLILLQTTLVMVGQGFVHYAAFAATRSAIVYIPYDGTAENATPRNVIYTGASDPKFEAIHSAAAFAVMPVCGRLESGAINTTQFTQGLRTYHDQFGQDPPAWIELQAADRLRYAVENTEVTLVRTTATDGAVDFHELPPRTTHRFAPRDPITVSVQHQLNLSVPYARAIFTDGQHTTVDGEGAYTNVQAQYTLTNEGVDPAMPPEPELPREDRTE